MANIVISVKCGQLTCVSKMVDFVIAPVYSLAKIGVYFYNHPINADVDLLFGAQGILGPPNLVVGFDPTTGTVQSIAA